MTAYVHISCYSFRVQICSRLLTPRRPTSWSPWICRRRLTRSITRYSFGGWNILLELAALPSACSGSTYISDLASSILALHSPLRSSVILASRKAYHSGRSYCRCSSHHSAASSRGLKYRTINMLTTLSCTLPLTKPQPRAHLPP